MRQAGLGRQRSYSRSLHRCNGRPMAETTTERLAMAAAVIAQGVPASARSAIPSFIVMDVMRAALAAENAGRSIIHMEVGQPGTPAPKVARTAAMRALE